ncbi:MAG TPA: iron-containing alcohol dehydrogenase [Pyrinomonadaceae bacterium]|nr:iron-containing alcohol dehydrogenase [Pyrinomonadaceae bacterium]
MQSFDYQTRTRVVFGDGAVARVGELARELNFKRTLLVADRGLVASGHVAEAVGPLRAAGVRVFEFHDFEANPDTEMIERGRAFAAPLDVDSIIGLGGGSSLDCAKGVNFVLTNGGSMRDYWGYGKAARPLLPMIGIPTTTGTGSEAQSYALVSDAATREKMACGDPSAAFRIALLDPALTVSQPRATTATAGFDALSHAVETFVTTRRNPVSEIFSREAWRLLEANYESALAEPENVGARGAMLLGAHFAGAAIEQSMLGATHACANPLTKNYDTEHGAAVALMLPHVVRWNSEEVGARYRELWRAAHARGEASDLAARLEELATAGGLPRRLRDARVPAADLARLADEAAEQWTGRFNPRAFDAAAAMRLYESAY